MKPPERARRSKGSTMRWGSTSVCVLRSVIFPEFVTAMWRPQTETWVTVYSGHWSWIEHKPARVLLFPDREFSRRCRGAPMLGHGGRWHKTIRDRCSRYGKFCSCVVARRRIDAGERGPFLPLPPILWIGRLWRRSACVLLGRQECGSRT